MDKWQVIKGELDRLADSERRKLLGLWQTHYKLVTAGAAGAGLLVGLVLCWVF